MSSYLNGFWSGWVIVLTALTLVIVTWLLFANRKRLPMDSKTTGHEYDGIEEWDNPLPGWWFAMFTLTIVWGIGYLIAYPGMGNFPGVLGWTSVEQHEQEVAVAEEKYRAMRDMYLAMPIEEIHRIRRLARWACASTATTAASATASTRPAPWASPASSTRLALWRQPGHDQAHDRQRPSGGHARLGGRPWRRRHRRGDGLPARSEQPRRGSGEGRGRREALPDMYCVACHGPEAKGNPMMGAPNLTNGIWLYGGTEEQIATTLRNGRNGQMPAFGERLSEDKIHLVTAYIYSLSQR
jgi:cytochrome c oxidase cbb3-type subunit 3